MKRDLFMSSRAVPHLQHPLASLHADFSALIIVIEVYHPHMARGQNCVFDVLKGLDILHFRVERGMGRCL